jgi:hypothetical protein
MKQMMSRGSRVYHVFPKMGGRLASQRDSSSCTLALDFRVVDAHERWVRPSPAAMCWL